MTMRVKIASVDGRERDVFMPREAYEDVVDAILHGDTEGWVDAKAGMSGSKVCIVLGHITAIEIIKEG